MSNLENLECKLHGITISGNPNLTNVDFLYNVVYPDECSFKMEKNPELDVSTLCENSNYEDFFNMNVFANKKDCGCRAEYFGTDSKYFQNCTAIFGTLVITNVSENSEAIASLANVKNLTGMIEISHTNLQNLSFFKNLEKFKYPPDYETALLLFDNPNMTRFAFDSVKYWVTNRKKHFSFFHFEALNSQFCFTLEEIDLLFGLGISFTAFEAEICPWEGESGVCGFENMESLPENCQRLMGKVIIGPGDEEYTVKLKTVTNIYGSLRIRNTSLENLDFFSNLKQIVNLNDTSKVIQIVSNPNLQNLDFPKLKNPFNVGSVAYIIIRDTPLAFNNSEECKDLMDKVKAWIMFDGGSCENVDAKEQLWLDAAFLDGDYEEEENKFVLETNGPVTTQNPKNSNIEKLLFIKPKCWFNKSEITKATIDSWPKKCETACGFITINKALDVPIAKLTSTFSKLKTLKGSIRIDNSTLKDLSFLSNLKNLECRLYGITISGNPNLMNVDFLYNVAYPDECPFEMERNPKLDVSALCENPNYENFFLMYVFANKKDCGCRAEYFDTDTNYFQNCTAIFGTLVIRNVSENSEAIASLANVKNFTGLLTIDHTYLQNLSFFKNLEKFKFPSNSEYTLVLFGNPNMTRFALDSVKYWVTNVTYTYPLFHFQALHPEFCFSLDELDTIFALGPSISAFEADICPWEEDSDVCAFETMKKLPEDCRRVIGRVIIGPGDEEYTPKLKNVTNIFGSLRIRNTSLENLDFFTNLRQVVDLNDTAKAIQIVSNPDLRDIGFPNLMYPYNSNKAAYIVVRETPLAFNSSQECTDLMYRIMAWVRFDGGDCGNVDAKKQLWLDEEYQPMLDGVTPVNQYEDYGEEEDNSSVQNRTPLFLFFIIILFSTLI